MSAPPGTGREALRHSAALRYLLPSERCVFAVRRHPMMLWRPVVAVYAAMMAVAFLWLATPPGSPLPAYGLVLVAAALVWVAARLVDWWAERLVVTDRRMLLVHGMVTRRVAMMPLAKVTDMTYERSPLARLAGYGTFVMESAGQDQALHRVTYVPDPDHHYLQVAAMLFGPRHDEERQDRQ